MSASRLRDIYQRALNNPKGPFEYQVTLGLQPISDRSLDLPTGSGKTATAVLSWLYQREVSPETTPRRLVYCLPMRALVEQTRRTVDLWLKNLSLSDSVIAATLMGGEVEQDWECEPTKPAILIGTQDMLLSRALNRGFAMSRFRWPVHFALVNNDCFWVMDEVQLAGSGLATSTQLQAFRRTWPTIGPTATWWMSATLDRQWLATVDLAAGIGSLSATNHTDLAEDLEKEDSDLRSRYYAAKPIERVSTLDATLVLKHHRPGTLTLVVVNTVQRARELYVGLSASPSKSRKHAALAVPERLLLHSRFRPRERQLAQHQLIVGDLTCRNKTVDVQDPEWLSRVKEHGLIAVATQVVEAGLDISAETLLTEIAPWASLVQRLGRVNRFGEQSAQVFWVDLSAKVTPPYEESDLAYSRKQLAQISDGSIASLAPLGPPPGEPPKHVIRRRDLLSLFSTERDLAGGFTDVSPFVRDLETETDVYVFWRKFEDNPGIQASPIADELCSAPLAGLKQLLENQHETAWEWNDETDHWEARPAWEIRPGMTLMLNVATGGYAELLGWTGVPHDQPQPIASPEQTNPDSQSSDPPSQTDMDWVVLPDHLREAERQAAVLLDSSGLDSAEVAAVRQALLWHDVGKAHKAWQDAVAKSHNGIVRSGGPWAKFPRTPRRFRPGLRHEAASALAVWRKWINGEPGWTALAVYLVAAHHGKVRTVLRSRLERADDVFGVQRGSELQLDGWLDQPVRLDLAPRLFGATGEWQYDGQSFMFTAPGWVEVIAALLEDSCNILADGEPRSLGPFRLAMLEALTVAGDVHASRLGQEAA